ncbi:MAG: hypothetical protein FWG77_04795 [Treponema sp.]|nr:hypothetical protein [Treponema sp.]
MANQELIKALDYILNRCNEQDIEAIAAAVVRRRRDITYYGGGGSSIPDPKKMAKDISSQINIGGNMESLTESIKEYAIRIIKQQAPELSDAQIDELTKAWIPSSPGMKAAGRGPGEVKIPLDLLGSMIGQFVAFSLGRMEEEEDLALRKEMGPWPDKYWNAFPQVIRLLIKDLLKGEIEEKEFNAKVGLALEIT